MDNKKQIKVYIASSVGIDYFFFLGKTIAFDETNVIPVFLISEKEYRTLAKTKGLKKIYLRIKMYIFYPLLLMWKAITSPRNSIFIVTSNTFYAPLLTKLSVFWKGVKVYHLLYDLFPDAIEVAGSIKKNGNLAKAIGWLTKGNFKYCNGTIYLGDFLKQHADFRWKKTLNSKVIHISTDLTLYNNEEPTSNEFDKIIIHYGGQLGHLHDANSIIAAIKYVLQSDIKDKVIFNFYVSGAQAAFLKESLQGNSINIIPAVDSKIWREDIKNFHIGLVTLSPGGASVCLPSKTYGMMAGGLAIMAVCPMWSDLAKLVLDNEAGWVVSNSPYNEPPISNIETLAYLNSINETQNIEIIQKDFYNSLKNIIDNKDLLKTKRKNAYHSVRQKYNAALLNQQWISFIKQVN